MTRPRAWPALVFLVHAAPRTVSELVELTGIRVNCVRVNLKALEAEGLVQREGLPAVWKWIDREDTRWMQAA